MNKENLTLLQTGHVIKNVHYNDLASITVYNTNRHVKYVAMNTVRRWLKAGLILKKEEGSAVLYRLKR